MNKHLGLSVALKAVGESGEISGVFSTDEVDSDGDMVLPSAFKPNQEVPLCWSHDWSRIIGKAAVRVMARGASFAGRLFLETAQGRDAYHVIRELGRLQEWSMGFKPVESHRGKSGERVITKLDLYEISAVLKGASRGTMTTSLKARELIPASRELAPTPPRERPPHVDERLWLERELHYVNRELEQAKLAKAVADLRRTSARVGYR